MIDRLFRNWKTTILGSVVLITCFVFVWFGAASLSELGLFVVGGFSMLFLKDAKENKTDGCEK